jgi:hypothetical protein
MPQTTSLQASKTFFSRSITLRTLFRKRYFEAHERDLLRFANIRLKNQREKDGRICGIVEKAMAKLMWPKKYDDLNPTEAAIMHRLLSPSQRG